MVGWAVLGFKDTLVVRETIFSLRQAELSGSNFTGIDVVLLNLRFARDGFDKRVRNVPLRIFISVTQLVVQSARREEVPQYLHFLINMSGAIVVGSPFSCSNDSAPTVPGVQGAAHSGNIA